MKNAITIFLIVLTILSCSKEEYEGTKIAMDIYIPFPEKPIQSGNSFTGIKYKYQKDECFYEVEFKPNSMPDYKQYINPTFKYLIEPTDDQITFYNMLEDRNNLIRKAYVDSVILSLLPKSFNIKTLEYHSIIGLFGYTFSFYHENFKETGLVALDKGNLLIARESYPYNPLEKVNCSSMIDSIRFDETFLTHYDEVYSPITGEPVLVDFFNPTDGKVRSVYEDYPPEPYTELDKSLNKVFWQMDKKEEGVAFTIEDGKAVIKE